MRSRRTDRFQKLFWFSMSSDGVSKIILTYFTVDGETNENYAGSSSTSNCGKSTPQYASKCSDAPSEQKTE